MNLTFDHVNGTTKQTWPCRCGMTHEGDYAFEDWAMHNCMHDGPLVSLDDVGAVACKSCGRTWDVQA